MNKHQMPKYQQVHFRSSSWNKSGQKPRSLRIKERERKHRMKKKWYYKFYKFLTKAFKNLISF